MFACPACAAQGSPRGSALERGPRGPVGGCAVLELLVDRSLESGCCFDGHEPRELLESKELLGELLEGRRGVVDADSRHQGPLARGRPGGSRGSWPGPGPRRRGKGRGARFPGGRAQGGRTGRGRRSWRSCARPGRWPLGVRCRTPRRSRARDRLSGRPRKSTGPLGRASCAPAP